MANHMLLHLETVSEITFGIVVTLWNYTAGGVCQHCFSLLLQKQRKQKQHSIGCHQIGVFWLYHQPISKPIIKTIIKGFDDHQNLSGPSTIGTM